MSKYTDTDNIACACGSKKFVLVNNEYDSFNVVRIECDECGELMHRFWTKLGDKDKLEEL